jgi:hypothetical protein
MGQICRTAWTRVCALVCAAVTLGCGARTALEGEETAGAPTSSAASEASSSTASTRNQTSATATSSAVHTGPAICPSVVDDMLEGCQVPCPIGTICVTRPQGGGIGFIGCLPIPVACTADPTCECLACMCGGRTCTQTQLSKSLQPPANVYAINCQ